MSDENVELGLVWEVEAIAKVIGRNVRQTSYLLSTGQIPAKKIGARWVAEKSELVRFFRESTGTNVDGGHDT